VFYEHQVVAGTYDFMVGSGLELFERAVKSNLKL